VFTMIVAFFFMGQRLSALQTWGVVLIIFGATLASLNWSDIQTRGFQLSLGVKEAALGAFFFGIYWNVSEIISEEIGWLSTTLFITIMLAIIFLKEKVSRLQGLGITAAIIGIVLTAF